MFSGLVHTCNVVYSLLAELSYADRDKYKGITKKELRVPVQRLVLILPVEEAEVDKGGDDNQDILSKNTDQDTDKFKPELMKMNTDQNYKWEELGPELVEHGNVEFLAVRRKESKIFDLVNLNWYRSDTVAGGDPSSSSTDLWQYFPCAYKNGEEFDVNSETNGVVNVAIKPSEVVNVTSETGGEDFERLNVGKDEVEE